MLSSAHDLSSIQNELQKKCAYFYTMPMLSVLQLCSKVLPRCYWKSVNIPCLYVPCMDGTAMDLLTVLKPMDSFGTWRN